MTIERDTILAMRQAAYVVIAQCDKALGDMSLTLPRPAATFDAVEARKRRVMQRALRNLQLAARFIKRWPRHRRLLENFAMPVSTLAAIMGNIPKAQFDDAINELVAEGKVGVMDSYQETNDDGNALRGRPARIVYMVRDPGDQYPGIQP